MKIQIITDVIYVPVCNVNRHTGTGYRLMTDRLKVARAALHMWKSLVYRENVEAEPYFQRLYIKMRVLPEL